MRWIAQPQRRGKRPGQSGQGAVEFALVGGLFFFLVFSIVNAGFFLYGRDTVEHAADAGVATIAAEGRCMAANGSLCLQIPANCPNATTEPSTADEVAICNMDQAGLTSTALITVTQIDVWQETQQSNGTFVNDTTDCALDGGPCEDIYNVDGGILNSGQTLPWSPQVRAVSGVNGPAFAKLVITFHYSLIATSGSVTMSTSNIFRLEPQQ